jgi:hypothetical protein
VPQSQSMRWILGEPDGGILRGAEVPEGVDAPLAVPVKGGDAALDPGPVDQVGVDGALDRRAETSIEGPLPDTR